MASQSFQAVRRLQDAGAPLPLVIANPVWQALIDKIDGNIAERANMLDQALSKIPASKRPAIPEFDDEQISGDAKRRRVGSDSADLAARKQALLAKIDGIEGGGAAESQDDYEAYRRQCWVQYYEWMEKQKQAGSVVAVPESGTGDKESQSEDEDEEIHNALLGLS